MIFLLLLLNCGGKTTKKKATTTSVNIPINNVSVDKSKNNRNNKKNNSIISKYIQELEELKIDDDNIDEDINLKNLMIKALKEFNKENKFVNIQITDSGTKEHFGKDNVTPLDAIWYFIPNVEIFKEIIDSDKKYIEDGNLLRNIFDIFTDFDNENEDMKKARDIVDYYMSKAITIKKNDIRQYLNIEKYSKKETSAIEHLINGMSNDPNDNGWTLDFIKKYNVSNEILIPTIVDIALDYEERNNEEFENIEQILLTFIDDERFKDQYSKTGVFNTNAFQYAKAKNKTILVSKIMNLNK